MKAEVTHQSEYVREGTLYFGIPFELRRCFSGDEYDESFYVIDGDFDRVVEAAKRLQGFDKHERDVYGKTLEISPDKGFSLVYRISGKPLIIVETENARGSSRELSCWEFSKFLGDISVRFFYKCTGDDSESFYVLYRDGHLIQYLTGLTAKVNGYEDVRLGSALEDKIWQENTGLDYNQYSLFIDRDTDIHRLEIDIYIKGFMENKLLELDVYAPYMTLNRDFRKVTEVEFTLGGLNPDVFDRIDCLYSGIQST